MKRPSPLPERAVFVSQGAWPTCPPTRIQEALNWFMIPFCEEVDPAELASLRLPEAAA